MQLLIKLKPSRAFECLSSGGNIRPSAERLRSLAAENKRHVEACVEQVRSAIRADASITPLSNLGCFLVECPGEDRAESLKHEIRTACDAVLDVLDNFPMESVTDTFAVEPPSRENGRLAHG